MGCLEVQIADRKSGFGRSGIATFLIVIQPRDDRLTTAVEVEVPHSVTQNAVGVEPAEDALEVPEAVDRHGLVRRSAPCTSDKRRDRSGNPGYCPHAAGNFLYVDAWVSRRD